MNTYDDKILRSGVPKLDDYPNAIPVPYSDPFDQPEPERHLRDYVHVLFRRKWTFFTFFLVVVTTVLLRTFLTTPIYRATVTLKIDDDRPAAVFFDRSNSYYAPASSEDYLQTMHKTLQSRNLARRVINALAQDKQIAPSSAVPAGLIRGNGEIDSGIVANFLSKVTVSPVPNTRLVMVGFDSTDPAVAATTANVIARACTELNMETKSNSTDWVRNLLENQLQEMKAKVERSEEALTNTPRRITWSLPLKTDHRNRQGSGPDPRVVPFPVIGSRILPASSLRRQQSVSQRSSYSRRPSGVTMKSCCRRLRTPRSSSLCAKSTWQDRRNMRSSLWYTSPITRR